MAAQKNKGTQLVFLDFGMSGDEDTRHGYNLYVDLIAKLTGAGISEKEIADIRSFDTEKK